MEDIIRMSEYGKITVDLGNSETRVNIDFKSKDGVSVYKNLFLSNKFYEFDTNSINIPSTYKPDTTSVFKITGEYSGVYANGDIVEKEYSSLALKPTAKLTKASFISALSFSLCVMKAVDVITEKVKLDLNDIDIEWDVVALMPPEQCTGENIDAFKEELRKINCVTNYFNKQGTNFKIPIKIKDVTVHPEGFSAFVGCIYTPEISIREGYGKYLERTILVLDIGAGTTDLIMIVNGEVVDGSKATISYGGLNVRAKAKKLIKAKYHYDNISDSELEVAISTGKLKDGSVYRDVSEYVMHAKREVSKALVAEIQDYLQSIDFSLRSVEDALIVGGGTLGGESGSGIEPMSKAIMENLKVFSPNIGEIELPTIVNENGKPEQLSARLVNFEGACVLSKAEQ